MKKYYVEVEDTSYLYTIVEAENSDDAYNKAKEVHEGWILMEGPGFWEILESSIREIKDDKKTNKE